MKKNPAEISYVLPESIAEEVGITPGDVLLEIGGKPIIDVFDYRFFCAAEEITLTVQKLDGEIWEIDIEKEFEDDLGIEFKNPMIQTEKSCVNKCVFCFVDQLPKGMRKTLYFKDDDSRLSFLTGNYVTLTNMSDAELDRIIGLKLSPINISVHSTDPILREKMLCNSNAGKVLEQIDKIIAAGITVNAQIVVCPSLNDGAHLEKSLRDLSARYSGVQSVSVVPVGLTRYRAGLKEIKPFDAKLAREVIELVQRFQKGNFKAVGSRIVFGADELYIKASQPLPGFEEYEDFPQIENGVGLIASLGQEIAQVCGAFGELGQMPKPLFTSGKRRVLIATGLDAEVYVKSWSDEVMKVLPGLEVEVIGVENKFFGEQVTVTGLLTGRDVCDGVLAAKSRGMNADYLILCSSMIRAGEDVFLDDFTIDDMERETGMQVIISDNSGESFVEGLAGFEIEIGGYE